MSQKQSSAKLSSQKASRSEKTYGLPRLTVDEAGRVLGVEPAEVTTWLGKLLHEKTIRLSQWSKWTRDSEPMAEAMIRLYLTQRRQIAEAQMAAFREVKEMKADMDRAKDEAERAAVKEAATVKRSAVKKRAASGKR